MADEKKESPSYLEQFLGSLTDEEHQTMFRYRLAIYEAIGPVGFRRDHKAALYAALMTAVAVGAAQEDPAKRLTEEQFVESCRLGYRACKEFFLERAVVSVLDQVREQLEGAPKDAEKH